MSEPLTAEEMERMEARCYGPGDRRFSEPDAFVRRLIAEVHRLQAELDDAREAACEYFEDLAYMDEYLFCKHYGSHEVRRRPWLKGHNPFPKGSPYFPGSAEEPEPSK